MVDGAISGPVMKVRPFERIVEDIPARYSARIEADRYLIQFGDGVEIPIPVLQTDHDTLGDFAMLQPLEQMFERGFKLVVEPELDEFAPEGHRLGCHIKLERRVSFRPEDHGIDPSQFAGVLAPPGPQDVVRSVSFNNGGGITGWTWFPSRQTKPLTAEDLFYAEVLQLLASEYGAYGYPSKREDVVGLVIDHPGTRYEWYWVPSLGKWVATIDPPLSTVFDEGAAEIPTQHVESNIPAWSRDAAVLALGIAAAMQLTAVTEKS